MNGDFVEDRFFSDPARLFISNGDGTFTERSREWRIADIGLGLGVVCFDYDNDGDIDIFVANDGYLNQAHQPTLYRNDGGNRNNFLTVKLQGHPPNTEAIGARVYVTVGTKTQMRELRAGSNFNSQDPAITHFGLAQVSTVDEVRVVWPDQTSTSMTDVAVRQRLVVRQP